MTATARPWTPSTAVIARRSATAPDELDYFPTPPWAARAGAELVRAVSPTHVASVWEPACGEGHMAAPLAESFALVIASDVFPYGYGRELDFLDPAAGVSPRPDWIITNSPFKTAARFAELGQERAAQGVALLLRLGFMEGVERFPLLYGDAPVAVIAPFAERVPMTKGRWDPKASSATAYAWFVWIAGHQGPPRVVAIPPGTRRRLTHPADAGRFGHREAAPLLDACTP